MPIVTSFGSAADAARRVQDMLAKLKNEAYVDRATYDSVAAQFTNVRKDKPVGVRCVLIDSFSQCKLEVKLPCEIAMTSDAWEMTLRHLEVDTILGLNILRGTYGDMGHRPIKAGAPRGGTPHLFFERIVGKDFAMPGWRANVGGQAYNPAIGRSLYYTKQVVYTDGSLPQITLLLPTSLQHIPQIEFLDVDDTQALVQEYYDFCKQDARERNLRRAEVVHVPDYKRVAMRCAACGKEERLLFCSKCGLAAYCSKHCQKAACRRHRAACLKAAIPDTGSAPADNVILL